MNSDVMNKTWLEFTKMVFIGSLVVFIVYQIAYGVDSEKWLDIIKILIAWGGMESGSSNHIVANE